MEGLQEENLIFWHKKRQRLKKTGWRGEESGEAGLECFTGFFHTIFPLSLFKRPLHYNDHQYEGFIGPAAFLFSFFF